MKRWLIRLTALLLCLLMTAGSAVAADFYDHLLLAYQYSGTCHILEGETDLIVVFVDVPEAEWSDEDIVAQRITIEDAAVALENEAAGFGVSLDFATVYYTSRADAPIRLDTDTSWVDDVMVNAGLPAMMVDEGDESPYADTPVIFCLNTGGRAFAQQGGGREYPEYLILFENFTPETIRHEMFHLYGARDYYEATAIKAAAEEYYPDSVMLSTSDGTVTDSLTAYLIGWQTSLDETAVSFLQATAHVTKEDLQQDAASGRITGYATINDDGMQYIGPMADGFRHGWGIMRYENGNMYIGDWYWGECTGKGTFIWSNGDIYSGDFVDGNRTGAGVFTWASGTTYAGTFADNQFHGSGTLTWSDGSVYTGDFVNDARTGQGTYTWPSGDSYTGEFLNNEQHGYGTCTYADGTVVSGLWQHNKYVGE